MSAGNIIALIFAVLLWLAALRFLLTALVYLLATERLGSGLLMAWLAACAGFAGYWLATTAGGLA